MSLLCYDSLNFIFRYSNDANRSIVAVRWLDNRNLVIMYTIPFLGEEASATKRKVGSKHVGWKVVMVMRPLVVLYYTIFMRAVDVA